MLAAGPRPPPYLKGDLYHPAVRTHALQTRALRLLQNTRDPVQSHGQGEEIDFGGFTAESLQAGSTYIVPFSRVIISVSCAISTLAIIRACYFLAHSWHNLQEGLGNCVPPGLVTSSFRTFRQGAGANSVTRVAPFQPQHPGPVRVLKKVRRRLHRHGNSAYVGLCTGPLNIVPTSSCVEFPLGTWSNTAV